MWPADTFQLGKGVDTYATCDLMLDECLHFLQCTSWQQRRACLPLVDDEPAEAQWCCSLVLKVLKTVKAVFIIPAAIIKSTKHHFVFAGFTLLAALQRGTDCPAKSVWMTRMKPTHCECCLCSFIKCWFVRGGETDTDSFTACFIDHIVVSQDICCYDL